MPQSHSYYEGIDIGRIVFACLIPLLHIEFGDDRLIWFVQQFVSRLGVPYFFATSGVMLQRKVDEYGSTKAFFAFSKRIMLIFLFWITLYSPIICINHSGSIHLLVQQILFRTPAYLWYLGAVYIGSIIVCSIPHFPFWGGVMLYTFGTMISGSYSWATGGISAYNHLFLTPRNGVFFAYPLMCIGRQAYKHREKMIKGEQLLILGSVMLLWVEISFVQKHISDKVDTSMYLTIPFAIYFIVHRLLNVKQFNFNTQLLRKTSSSIYVSQFGTIYLIELLFNKISGFYSLRFAGLIEWGIVLLVGLLLAILSRRCKYLNYII